MAEETNLALDIDWTGANETRTNVARISVVRSQAVTRDGTAPIISSDCTSYSSVAHEVERLKAELDELSAQAHDYFEGRTRAKRSKTRRKSSQTATPAEKAHVNAELSVRDVMTRDVKTLHRNERLSLAEELMDKERFRHVVVVDDQGKLAGVISHRDIFYSALAWSMGQGKFSRDTALKSFPVKPVMRTNVLTAEPDTPLADAATLMMDHKIGCLPVIDGDQLVGILTQGDFLAILAHE